MNIEIKITAESVEEARAAFAQLAGERPATHITVIPDDPRIKGGELTIPAGTDLTVAAVTRDSVEFKAGPDPTPMPEPEPEKPKAKRTRKTAAKAAETPQEPPVEPEAPQAEQVTAAPEKPAEEPVEATVAPAPTKEQIATAGARLLDANPNAMQPLIALLKEYDVQAITYLKDDQLAGFAEKLRALGAEV